MSDIVTAGGGAGMMEAIACHPLGSPRFLERGPWFNY